MKLYYIENTGTTDTTNIDVNTWSTTYIKLQKLNYIWGYPDNKTSDILPYLNYMGYAIEGDR